MKIYYVRRLQDGSWHVCYVQFLEIQLGWVGTELHFKEECLLQLLKHASMMHLQIICAMMEHIAFVTALIVTV